MEEKLYWIWLTQLEAVGPVLSRKLLDVFIDPYKVYCASKEELLTVDGIGEGTATKIINSKHCAMLQAEAILEQCELNNIKILTMGDKYYPLEVNAIHKCPILLFYKGTIIEDSTGVGIVGARRCTEYGKRMAIEAAAYLSGNNIPVISGMAKGIDSYAHTSAIKNNGYTLAFLGCGLNYCYPVEHMSLMEAIIENGAVISEYPPNIKPYHRFFIERNRLIAAWSKSILIAEGSETSGALKTVEYALSYNKPVYAPPSSIYIDEAKGTNKLLSQGKANVYLSPNQLISNEEKRHKPSQVSKNLDNKKDDAGIMDFARKNEDLPKREVSILKGSNDKYIGKVLEILSKSTTTQEELSLKLGCDYTSLMEILLTLELEGKIKVSGGAIKLS